MGEIVYVDDDLVTVKHGSRTTVLAWGDPIEILGKEDGRTRVRVHERGARPFEGTVRGTRIPTRPESVLKFSMVDVQQGDAMVLETPAGRKILIDGGDNKLFARYLAARYRGTSAENPLDIDAIIVTHGDADHFASLNIIRTTETDTKLVARKRLFLRPHRVFHNGLLKAGTAVPEEKRLGRTVATRDGRAIVDLHDDFLDVADDKLNRPFTSWRTTLKHWRKRGPISIKRLAFGDRREFDFLRGEGIEVDVLGPIPMSATVGGRRRPALPLLRQPPKSVELPLDNDDDGPNDRRFSASHTINGHSVALKLTYGNVRFMLTGDLNQESMEILRKKVTNKDLQAEILKAPHHGSADFDLKALEAMAPVVSLISSGDESSRKEHIHPRATLMGALGRVARGDTSIVLCTELAAFFELKGLSKVTETGERFFGFERTSFGIIHIRTDGERVLVFTHSGKENMKEAYRFTVNERHEIKFAKDVKKR